MGLAGASITGGSGIAAQHLRGMPAGEAHEVGLVAALGAPAVGEGVAEHVRMQALDAGLLATAPDDLRDTASGQRALLADPQRYGARMRMPDTHPKVAVERLGRPMTERKGAGPAALADHIHHVKVEVDVLPPDLGQLLQPGTSIEEQVKERVVVQDRDRLLGYGRRLEPRHGVADAFLFLQPTIEAVKGTEAIVGGRGPATLDDVDDVVLDVGGGGLGEGTAATVEQRRELFDCLEVGVDGALVLALGPHVPLKGTDKRVYAGTAHGPESSTSYTLLARCARLGAMSWKRRNRR